MNRRQRLLARAIRRLRPKRRRLYVYRAADVQITIDGVRLVGLTDLTWCFR